MTKAELMAALGRYTDDAEVYIETGFATASPLHAVWPMIVRESQATGIFLAPHPDTHPVRPPSKPQEAR